MTISSVTSAAASTVPIYAKGEGKTALDQAAFLKLMTTQLKQQDPFSPLDNTEMVAQMAQFSSVSGIGEMNSSLKSIAGQITDQTKVLHDLTAAIAKLNNATSA
jgi:flagellar basal-body rod modification protein FlgD